jgi:predicted O-methyltransferase YrrM
MKEELRKKEIKEILLNTEGLLTLEEAKFLYTIAKRCNGNIVEIGSYKGGSTILLAKGVKDPYKVYAIDPHYMDSLNEFKKNIIKFDLKNKIKPIFKDSKNVIKKWNKKFDILWIDGYHDYKDTKTDFLLWEYYLKINGLILFHDSIKSKKKVFSTGFPMVEYSGPRRVVKEYIKDSKRFKIIHEIDSITCAKKIRDLSFKEIIKREIYKYFLMNNKLQLYFYIDNKIGFIGKIIYKMNPKIYYLLKNFK